MENKMTYEELTGTKFCGHKKKKKSSFWILSVLPNMLSTSFTPWVWVIYTLAHISCQPHNLTFCLTHWSDRLPSSRGTTWAINGRFISDTTSLALLPGAFHTEAYWLTSLSTDPSWLATGTDESLCRKSQLKNLTANVLSISQTFWLPPILQTNNCTR